jgi:hypothetical protein
MTQGTPQEPQRPPYERRHRDEKDEKQEKQEEKDEKSRNEKDWDEKWRRDPINAISWAMVFIWAGLGLLGETTGWGPDTFRWWETWAVIMAGAGAILILFALIRLMMPEHRRPITGNLIMGFIFLGVGLGEMTEWGWGVIGAIVLIGIGLIIILGGIFRRRR